MKKIISIFLSLLMLVSIFSATLSVNAASTQTEPTGEKVLWASYNEMDTKWRWVKEGRISWPERYQVIKANYGFAIYRTKISESKTEYTYILEAETLKNGEQTKYYKSKEMRIEKEKWNNIGALAKNDKRLRKLSIPDEISQLQATIKIHNQYQDFLDEKNGIDILEKYISIFCDEQITNLTNECKSTLSDQASLSDATKTLLGEIINIDSPILDVKDTVTEVEDYGKGILEFFEEKIVGTMNSNILSWEEIYNMVSEYANEETIIIDYDAIKNAVDALKKEIGNKSQAAYKDIYRILG